MAAKTIKILLLLIALIWGVAGGASLSLAEDPLERLPEDPFAAGYVHFELTRNFPVGKTREQFDAGPYHPAFAYIHNVDGTWLMGFGGQYRILNKKVHDANESDQVALFTLTHEALASWRLYHPTYLLVGPQLFYLFPGKLAKLPMQKEPAYETEIGAGLSVMVSYVFTNESMLTLRVNRWRGTKTTRFQGIESSFGFAYALK